MIIEEDGSFGLAYTNGGASNVIKSGSGVLSSIIIMTPALNDVITVYDNTAASGTKIATIDIGGLIRGKYPLQLVYDLTFRTGLTLSQSSTSLVHLVYA